MRVPLCLPPSLSHACTCVLYYEKKNKVKIFFLLGTKFKSFIASFHIENSVDCFIGRDRAPHANLRCVVHLFAVRVIPTLDTTALMLEA